MSRIPSLLLASLLALGGCQAVPRPDLGLGETRTPGDADPVLPEGRHYVVDPESSQLRLVIFPAGPLARFGHPHVIGGTISDGEVVVADPFHASGLRLEIAVGELEVDRPEWRSDEGFDPDMSESAIADTRANMLDEDQLDAERHPVIQIESVGLNGPPWQPDIEIRITLAGTSRELTVPVALRLEDQELEATGRFALRQSDFGITPFSAAGGNLQVADEVLIRFRILARARDPG